MNLYLITRNKKPDYPAYDKAIVAAQTQDEATKIIEADIDNWTEVYINRKMKLDITISNIGLAAEGVEAGILVASTTGVEYYYE